MKPEDYKYTLEIRLEEITYEQVKRVITSLNDIDPVKVKYKEYSKKDRSIAERTSI